MIRFLRRFVLYPLLFVSGCYFLGTGSPFPLWYYEELVGPRQVVRITEAALVLDDGRRVPLPYIKSIPEHSPLLGLATKYGVEVTLQGEVIGLLDVSRICGNDPVCWRRLRVSLSDLVGVLHPERIDDSVVPTDIIELLTSNFEDIDESVAVSGHLVIEMDHFRRSVEKATGAHPQSHRPVNGRSGRHDRRTGGLVL